MQELKNKKGWIDKLYYHIGKQQCDFELSGTYKKKDGDVGFSKWMKYSECIFPVDFDGSCSEWKAQKFFEQINQRQILPIEVVLDIEEKDKIKEIVEKLKELNLIFYVFSTGSRGYHIHIFFNEVVEPSKKLALIKYFGADEMKDKERVLISLEYAPHWKSGKIKERVIWK